MLRYLKRPKETEEYFDFEEFGHTGDLGFYNQEGWITYVDRMKEVIKYKNNHVAPTEIEDILQKHEAVQESLVFGKKEPSVQELITAVVIIKPDKNVSIQQSKQIFSQSSNFNFHFMAIRVVEFSNRGYKIRKIFA